MTDAERHALYKTAIETWGEDAQINLLGEECSELSADVSRVLRERSEKTELVEEIADVEIMLEQMRLILDAETINEAKAQKRSSLRQRLQETGATIGSQRGSKQCPCCDETGYRKATTGKLYRCDNDSCRVKEFSGRPLDSYD